MNILRFPLTVLVLFLAVSILNGQAMTLEEYLEIKRKQHAKLEQTPTDEQLTRSFEKLDTNSDGFLCQEELAAAKERHDNASKETGEKAE
jgi:Ca2+-binding EF-hand superfamily protein